MKSRFFFFSSRRRHTRYWRDWSSDVCSSDLAIFRELKVDMVLSGHRHVPYVWSISGVRIVHSGTASSMRVRGTMPPSYNVIDFDEESVRITLKQPGKGKEGEDPLASFSRTPVTTSEFYPDFDR